MTELRHWWWLSFADEAGFLCGAFAEGTDFGVAVVNVSLAGANPGGKCLGIDLGEAPVEKLLPLVPHRLYSKAELDEIDGVTRIVT